MSSRLVGHIFTIRSCSVKSDWLCTLRVVHTGSKGSYSSRGSYLPAARHSPSLSMSLVDAHQMQRQAVRNLAALTHWRTFCWPAGFGQAEAGGCQGARPDWGYCCCTWQV